MKILDKLFKKKGQVWTLDFIMSLIVFVGLIILAINLLEFENPRTQNKEYQERQMEADYISNMLLTTGIPVDWNETNVLVPGITENQRINLTKLDMFDELDYQKKKSLLQVKGDFLFFFENSSDTINKTKCFRGYDEDMYESCELNLSKLNYDDLAKTERIIILDSELVNLVIYVWS